MTSSRPNEALSAVVHGRVQGVGFRIFVQHRAQELGLTGGARNLDDSRSLEVVAEGPREALEALLVDLRTGPELAEVEDVELTWSAASGKYKGFDGADPTHNPSAILAIRAVVHGRVQGVGFRAFVQRRGLELGLKGVARNLSDGRSVEVVAEGQRAALEALVAALKLGPSGAYVESVDLSWSEATGSYSGFLTGLETQVPPELPAAPESPRSTHWTTTSLGARYHHQWPS